ncbi:two-component response regulator [hydrocarbon metagenome]|uniref:Two-component response regulator n=1 Tax=hydrocarbon metagenome TaxID=938273 RepID=A0A0W8E3A4_9ZZZZ
MVFEVLILEDEEYNREFLKKIIGEVPEVTAVYVTSSGEEAVTLAQKHKPNLVLLDIELSPGDLNGLTVAKSIFSNDQDCFIVFITGYTKYALQSFAVHPYDFIVKPINKAKLKTLVMEIAEKSNKQKNNSSDIITLKGKGEVFHINQEDIIFIEKYGKEAQIHTGDEMFTTYQTLDEIENSLSSSFFRSHKSYLINVDKVQKVGKNSNRSYQVRFHDYDKTAMMSRDKYKQYLLII